MKIWYEVWNLKLDIITSEVWRTPAMSLTGDNYKIIQEAVAEDCHTVFILVRRYADVPE